MILELDHISVSIGATPVLLDVSLKLDAGSIYGLLGPNGAGKSTTIAAALGLLKPSNGTVRLFGSDPTRHGESLRAQVGILPEHGGLYEWMAAEEYLDFYAALYGCSLKPKEIAARLEIVGLAPRAKQPLGTYSRGMRQRLGLARALIANPRLLVLDEPTNGLDPRGRRDMHDVLLAIAGEGAAVLLCTHLLDDVERLCNRIGFIVGGRSVGEGSLADLLREGHEGRRFRLRLAATQPSDMPSNGSVCILGNEGEWTIVEVDPSRQPAEVWRELMFGGWAIVEIQRLRGGLEDLYLDLTQEAPAARRAA